MKIKLNVVKLGDVFRGYKNEYENGVVALDGKLDIRPKYQREFVYKEGARDAVVRSVVSGRPISVMYWLDNGDGTFGLIDGQQRTMSLCEYMDGNFSVDNMYYFQQPQEIKDQFEKYPLMVYLCSEGTEKEYLEWFNVINTAGERLTPQELRNSVYTGPWLTSAKAYFSKSFCPAVKIASDYVSGSAIRQEVLERALAWISEGKIEDYMAQHRNDENADELWNYFEKVITWVKATFPETRKEMKGVEWGVLYNTYKDTQLDPTKTEETITTLIKDPYVGSKRGIYTYVFTKDVKELSIDTFSESMKRYAYKAQNGKCFDCGAPFNYEDMDAAAVTSWENGGVIEKENCKVVCHQCKRKIG